MFEDVSMSLKHPHLLETDSLYLKLTINYLFKNLKSLK